MSDQIYRAIVDLRDRNRVATRQVIAELTGLKLTIVDDHIKRMKDNGLLRSPVNGVVEPTDDTVPDRAVSVTVIPNGGVKLEIGDHVLELTPREARQVGTLTGGFCLPWGREAHDAQQMRERIARDVVTALREQWAYGFLTGEQSPA